MTHNKDLETKIIEAIDRISRAQKILLWDRAKIYGLTPLQTQILLLVSENKEEKNNISLISLELGVSQPTISDAVKTLINKGLLQATVWEKNKHFRILSLTDKGKEIIKKLKEWDSYLKRPLKKMEEEAKVAFFNYLLNYVVELRNDKTLLLVRACPLCRYFVQKEDKTFYCKLFNMEMKTQDLRVECPDYEEPIQVLR
ncbi:MAG TPA: MarR family winged helix-turn-helix transcriptional regulator [Geobacterales bacterium]|nr:MarR family winged helix-turn-helix transcriptional regulator [Geobacterales bacterium]